MIEEKIKMPLGLKIISVLMYINTIFAWIFAIILILASPIAASYISSLEFFSSMGATELFVIINSLGLGLFAEGILCYFVYKGLKRRQAWAKDLLNILSWLGLFGSIFFALFMTDLKDIIQNAIELVLNAILAFYLTFSRKVKIYFSRREI